MSGSEEDKNINKEIKEIFADFKQKKQQAIISEENYNNNIFHSAKVRKFCVVLGSGISVILSFYLLCLVFGQNSPFTSPEPWAIGQRFSSDHKIDGCIFRLWQVKRSIDLYYSENKVLPENMQQLYDGGFLKQRLICPASNKDYVFKIKNNQKVFVCPEPEAHNQDIISIYCRVINSPPVIERYGEVNE